MWKKNKTKQQQQKQRLKFRKWINHCKGIPNLFCQKSNIYIGVQAGGEGGGGLQHPLQILSKLRFFGQQEKLGQSQFLRSFHVFLCFEEIDIFYFNLKSAWLIQLASHKTVVA